MANSLTCCVAPCSPTLSAPPALRAHQLLACQRRTPLHVVAATRSPIVEEPAMTSDALLPGGGEAFWKKVPMYADVDKEDFMSYKWQVTHSMRSMEQITMFLKHIMPHNISFREDVLQGMERAPMSISLTPYVLSCIDWSNPIDDPIRKQFLPLASTREPDHPMSLRDSQSEEVKSPVPGLVRRYPSKAVLLSTTVCPIYCRFCFRSYVVGSKTSTTTKNKFEKPNKERWKEAFQYLNKHPEIDDLVISGGDIMFLSTEDLEHIGNTLLSIPHIRRFRFGTRALTAAPMRVLNDESWTNTICSLASRGRELGKNVALHLHFNHPNEITWVTELAALKLFQKGVIMRNQSVLLRGINDSVETMSTLIQELANNNIQPYYVFQGELVKGVEDLRTPLSTSLKMEKEIQGLVAGFNIPKFCLQIPCGGGKQYGHNYESYDPVTGISTWRHVIGNKDVISTYCDPLHALHPEMQKKWLNGELTVASGPN